MDELRRQALSRLGTGVAMGGLIGLMSRDLRVPALVSYWGDPLPLVVVAAAAGAVLSGTRLRPALVAGTATLALLWSIAAFTPASRAMMRGLVRRDAPRSADAVFVLASRLQMDGEPTAVAMSRLLHGLELLGEGRAPRLIVSELAPPYPAGYAAYARGLMSSLGLKGEVLAVGPGDRTRDEAEAVAALCRERGWTRLLVVTSPSHSRRASGALQQQGLDVVSSPAIETRFDLETLDGGEERLEAFGTALHEWLGLWIYEQRGWIGPRPAGRPLSSTPLPATPPL